MNKPPLDLPRFLPLRPAGWFAYLPSGAAWFPFPMGATDPFDLATGAAALDESLALRRELDGAAGGWRSVNAATIPGITVAEHPWEKMMGGKVPAPEPLARLVPRHNWYLTVTDPAAVVRAWEVLDTWGGSVLRSPTVQDRHYGTRGRYERQLGLPSADVVAALPAGLVEAVALTGSDLYWLEGSDVTALVQVKDVAAFLRLHDGHLARAARDARRTTEKAGGVTIDSWVSPRREVSLHRATVGKVVVCSNSPVALRHVLEVHAGTRPPLADALDFRYMRTVFVRDAKAEDGFAFLSDAFVRRLVGPATRIKQMRRQRARAALVTAGAAAVYAAVETGRLPGSLADLLAGSGLPAGDLEVPEGKPVTWDAKTGEAASEAYGTLGFSTPLVDLPIDRVTPREEAAYERFREEYLTLWRRYFDPVGIRFKVGPGPTRVEVYLLPLVRNSAYNDLRAVAGRGTVRYSPARIPETTVFRWLSRLTLPEGLAIRAGQTESGMLDLDGKNLDLTPVVDRLIAAEMEAKEVSAVDLVLGKPVLASFEVKDREKFLGGVYALLSVAPLLLDIPFEQRVPEGKYRGVTLDVWGESPRLVAVAAVGDRVCVGTDEGLVKRWIDRTLDEGKAKPADLVEVNTAVYFAPPRGPARTGVEKLLEWETHKLAMTAAATWQLLYRTGVVRVDQTAGERAAAARRLLGYVPASPDGTAFRYDPKRRAVTNDRHGSLDRPTLRPALADDAPASRLLRQLKSVRADLRFREDGIHTTVTIDWVK